MTGEAPVHLWNPNRFDPLAHVDRAGQADLARYFLHRIIYGKVFRQADEDGFVPLKAEFMRPFYPKREVYQKIRDSLIGGGAVECDRRYIVGEKAQGYRLGPEYRAMGQSPFAVRDRTLARKMRLNVDDWRKMPGGVHRQLIYWLHEIEIDADVALKWASDRPDYEPSDRVAILMLRDRVIHWNFCAYGRLHSNLTNLRSGLRRFLSYRGQPLVNLDVRNSQPLVFARIIRAEFGAELPEDAERYISLVETGRFYDDLMHHAGIPPEERARFKRSFFALTFFCKNEPEMEAARMFGRLYPNVYALIREKKAVRYEALAWELQRAESDIIIERIAKRCTEEHPLAFIATIHDSVLTTDEHAGTFQRIMREEFARVGLNPTINIEPLGTPPVNASIQ